MRLRIVRWFVPLGLVSLLSPSCTSGPDESRDTTLAPTTAVSETTITTASTTTAPTTTTAASTATIAAVTDSPYPEAQLVPLEPEAYLERPLGWVRANATLDRTRRYWLGTIDSTFVLLSWERGGGDYRIQTSDNGRTWSGQEPTVGLPDSGTPVFDVTGEQVRSGRAGMIVAIGDDPWIEESEPALVFTSSDGRTWTVVEPSVFEGSPYLVSASHEGFAVVETFPSERHGERANAMYVADADGEWRRVEIPGEEDALWWVSGFGADFIAKGPDQKGMTEDEPTYIVSTTSELTMGVSLGDHVPTPWLDGALVHNEYGESRIVRIRGHEPTFYSTADAITWERLPFPPQPDSDEPDHYQVTSIGTGDPDLLIAGCSGCQGHLEFHGNSFGGIAITKDGYRLDVWGGTVLIFNAPNGDLERPLFNNGAGQWFDVTTGTLQIPANEHGPGVEVSCDEMRQVVVDMQWPEESEWALVEMVPQDLWHSPKGRSWNKQDVRTIFGPDAWIEQTTATKSASVVLVAPNGERPIADPPGCELGFYPKEEPLEIWATDLTSR